MSQLVRMLQDFWPDNSRTLSAYYRNPGRIIQESCPRVTGTLSGCYKNNHYDTDHIFSHIDSMDYSVSYLLEVCRLALFDTYPSFLGIDISPVSGLLG